MRLVAIINPISGASKESTGLNALFRRLRSAGIQADRQVTTGPGSARDLAQRAADYADTVLAVGGDGTVREIADGLAGGAACLMVWPRGTENLVAKSLGFRADPDWAIRCLTRGRILTIDLGLANGTSFMVVAGVGFDAEVVYRLTQTRVGHINHLSYFWPIWRTFWEHPWPPLRVRADSPQGPLSWEGQGMIFIGNMARYSLGLPVVRDARPDDGLLDLCFMTCRNPIQLLRHTLRTMRGTHVEHRDVRYARVTHLRVESPEAVPVQIDGDFAGWLPLDVAVRPAVLRVKVPPVTETG